MICLTQDEIREVTHRQKYAAQRSALNTMGIDYKIRPDGSLFVAREALLASARPQAPKKRNEPNWEALNHG